ncbi:MAG: DNA translocase FtsK [Chlamydiia bacterium]|nr:DNA translocase FtsK [Chlamydiia bacterium]
MLRDMKRAIRTRKKRKKKAEPHPEARGVFIIAGSLFLFLCLFTFVDGHHERNVLGLVGHVVAHCLNYLFGLGSYVIVSFLAFFGWKYMVNRERKGLGPKVAYMCLHVSSLCILLNLFAETKWLDFSPLYDRVYSENVIINASVPIKYIRYNLGGVPFYYIYKDMMPLNLQHLLSDVGVLLTFFNLAIIGFVLLTDMSFFKLFRKIASYFPVLSDYIVFALRKILFLMRKFSFMQVKQTKKGKKQPLASSMIPPYTGFGEKKRNRREPKALKKAKKEVKEIPKKELKMLPQPKRQEIFHNHSFATDAKVEFAKQVKAPKGKVKERNYDLPPLDLLTNTPEVDQTGLKRELQEKAQILEQTLASFSIDAKVGHIHSGPTITSFEVHPAIGVKVQKIKALENDIALNLQARSIRIIAPIPGKAAVGVEIPSLIPQDVGFKDMLNSYRKLPSKHNIPVLLGKTVRGEDVMCDLTKMPHCIIAGATGSGKSVCINTMIMSILMNCTPDKVKLLLVDPKKVELTFFAKIPHLIAPVITEPEGAYAALKWIVKEMKYRYEMLKRLGVRNIAAFNKRKIDKDYEASLEMEIPSEMYYMVAIIDEFADLMMTSSSDLETPIARIAQMARAVGIHLVLATQRPSREVITGLIKANFPTRIAFKVSSRINSQIILDENGAESLLGNGDMLFLAPGTAELLRCQGVYVSDEDIKKVVRHIQDRFPTNYLFDSFDNISKEDVLVAEKEQNMDPLYPKALEIVMSFKTASTTFLQRKLKIGYARAASLMDALEENGIISGADGSKPRKILRDDLDS